METSETNTFENASYIGGIMMNIAFYISGKSGRLSKYLNQISEESVKDIKLVFSDYMLEEPLKTVVSSNNISIIEKDYDSIPGNTNREKNLQLSNQMLSAFRDYSIDYCISFGTHILSGELIENYENKIINFHPAILPMFPGMYAMDKAKEFGNVLLVGNTAHFIDKGVDTGPIIMQSVTTMQAFLVDNDYNVVLDQQIPMLNRILKALKKGDLEVIDNRVSIKNADYSINHFYPEYE